jgi:alpha-ketoglutarate-dependent taurine dioxygenase
MLEVRRSTIDAEHPLPVVISPVAGERDAAALSSWLSEHEREVEGALSAVGGVLFRGFDLPDEVALERVAQSYLRRLLPYLEGQSPRTKVRDSGLYTSTEYPSNQTVTLHHELSYAAEPPKRILFFCKEEASEGGETPIVDGRRVAAAIDPAIRERFERLGVLYFKHMHGEKDAQVGRGKSWQNHFETEDRSQVESYLRRNEVEFEWGDDNSLTTRQRRPALVPHRGDGRPVWFNQANLWHLSNFPPRVQKSLLELMGERRLPTHAYFGDGSPIPAADLQHVRDVCLSESTRFLWRRCDLLILDNLTVAHGRMPFAGPRKILVAMG